MMPRRTQPIGTLFSEQHKRLLTNTLRFGRTTRCASAHPLALSFAAALVAASWMSPAQAATPGRITNIVQLGDCMYKAHRNTSLRLLNAADAAAGDQAVAKLKDERTCFDGLPNELSLDESIASFSKGLIRGTIAEAALRSSAGATSLEALPFEQKRYVRPWFATTGRDPAVDEMSTCVADTDPKGVVALISTQPDTYAESYALGDLQPWLARCLSAGRRVQADRTALRAALADALYQRVRNPALSAAQPMKTEASH